MANLQASIELCNTERADQNKKIDEARKQISYYEDAIKDSEKILKNISKNWKIVELEVR